MISRYLLLLYFGIISLYSVGQPPQSNARLDSLLNIYNNEPKDTGYVRACHDLYRLHYRADLHAAISYARKGLRVAKDYDYSLGIGTMYNDIGLSTFHLGESDRAREILDSAAQVLKGTNNPKEEANSYRFLANIDNHEGNMRAAVSNLKKALSLAEDLGEKKLIASCLGNLGIIHEQMGHNREALEYYNDCIKIFEEENDIQSLGIALLNVGNVYDNLEKYDSAIYYYDSAEVVNLSTNNVYLLAMGKANAGNIEHKRGNLTRAHNLLSESIKMYEQLNHIPGLASATSNLGTVLMDQKQYGKALAVLLKAKEYGEKSSDFQNLMRTYDYLAVLYNRQGQNGTAYDYLREYTALRDSFLTAENQEALAEMEAKYKSEKKELEIQALESERLVQAAEIAEGKEKSARQNAELNAKRNQQYALFGGLGLVLIFSLFIFNRFHVTKKQKGIIEVQKNEVEKQRNEAEHQKEIVEEKNKEILDSINYAKRLQEAILPPARLVKEWLPQSFILYKPKDIVAGDFYWMETAGDWIYFAAADCTGHGVPGAMVSVVCSNALTKSLIEEGIKSPAAILDRTRELVIDRFGRSEEEIKDGMDISLCALHWKTGKLQWSGANNPLWIIRKDAEDVEEVKADKQPIGKYGESKPFTNHELQLSTGDSLYIFSDGFPDQFGGERGKKYKSGKLKTYFLSIQDKEMQAQRSLLSEEFENWRGDIEQIDDVCIIGVRI